jgi:hypothetical protein
MKNIKKRLAEMVWWKLPLSKIILEQGLFDEPADEEGGDEEAEDEGGDEEAEEGEEAAADAEAGEEGAEAEEEVAIEAGDEVRLGKQLDAQLDSMLLDFEANALKSAAIADETYAEEEEQADVMVALEWWQRPLSKMLVEQEEEIIVSESTLDIETFANDVFRLIQNYDVLLDMENAIYNKAMGFLQQKYGDEIAASFEEVLRVRHGLDFSSQAVDMVDEIEPPLAQGAGGGGDMGGA